MSPPTANLRVLGIRPLISPAILNEELPITPAGEKTVEVARAAIKELLCEQDDRLLVVVGPCSIHDPDAALEYAQLLLAAAERLREDLLIVMRVYFEKPRTTVGWKGLINDPHLDESFQINTGLRTARRLLCDLTGMGVPCGCEFLDPISPQYISGLVSWGAIGARTTESQVHRELAVALAFGGARADRAPAHQVADELRAEQIQELGAHRQAQREHVEQQRTRHLQALVDREAAIKVRVVDIALPAYGGARLLEVHAHHHHEVFLPRIGLRLEQARVRDGLLVVVDGTRADDDHQAVVLPVQHARDRRAAGFHQGLCGVGGGLPFLQQRGRDQRAHGADAQVVDAGGVVGGQNGVGGVGFHTDRDVGHVTRAAVVAPQPLKKSRSGGFWGIAGFKGPAGRSKQV